MSETIQKQKEKIIIVIRGGNLAGIYSSIPEKSIDVEVMDYDSRGDHKIAEEYLNEQIESGVTPFELY